MAQLNLEGLNLTFDSQSNPGKVIAEQSAPLREVIPAQEAARKEALEIDELQVKEEQLAMLLLEDPLEFERQLEDGELLDDEGSDGPPDQT